MNKLQNIVAYLCLNYPYKSELSKARLTKLVYLADWFSAVVSGKQMTSIQWVFNHYGPYVDDVINAVDGVYGFSINREFNMYGAIKNVISFEEAGHINSLSERDCSILDTVIKNTQNLHFNDFIDYVYSTYPVQSHERYSMLNLELLAKQYNAL
jgi:uncharacterized protein YwgA